MSLRNICFENQIIQPYTKKFDGLVVNNNEIVTQIIRDLGKVTKSLPNLEWSFCSHLLSSKYKVKGNSRGFAYDDINNTNDLA